MTTERVSEERIEAMLSAEIPLGMSVADARSILTELQSLRSARKAEPVGLSDKEIIRLEETLGALEGRHGEGWINITMDERRLFARLLREHIRHPSPSTEGLGVKGLEWGERRVIHGVNWAWDAKTSIDWYVVATASGERCQGSHYWFVAGDTIKGWANSEADAKAAAQADYERRILSALSTSAEQVETVPEQQWADPYLDWDGDQSGTHSGSRHKDNRTAALSKGGD